MTTFLLPEEIRDNGTLPKYRQIYAQFKKELFFGKYNEGDRFFSIRDLRARYGVNAETIRTAVDCLVEDGFIACRPMSGLYVNGIKERRRNSRRWPPERNRIKMSGPANLFRILTGEYEYSQK